MEQLETVQKLDGVRLSAPAGTTSVNHQGFEFTADEDGTIVVPASAVPMLGVHGFTAYVPKADDTIAKRAADPEAGGAGDDQGEANTTAPATQATAPAAPWAKK